MLENTNQLQGLEYLTVNTLDICHHYINPRLVSKTFQKLTLNLTRESFKWLMIWQLQLISCRLPSKTQIRNIMSSYSYFLFAYFFTLILKLYWNRQQHCPILYTFYDRYFPQVGDIDPWTVTWPNLSDLIGWGQQIKYTYNKICDTWGWVFSAHPFLLRWLWEYMHVILLLSSNQKHDP